MNGNYPYGAIGGNGFGPYDEGRYGNDSHRDEQMDWRQHRGAGRDEWPDRPHWRRTGGQPQQQRYGAPERQRGRDYNPGYEDQDYSMGRDAGMGRDNEGWRGYVDDSWRGTERAGGQAWSGAGQGYGRMAGGRGRPQRSGWGGDYRNQDYRGQEMEGRDRWGQQGYGEPYRNRDWGTRNYHDEEQGWFVSDQDEHPAEHGWHPEESGWQGDGRHWQGSGQRQRSGNYDASRSSQGNRRYPGFAAAYTGETQGRGNPFGSEGWQADDTQRHHRGRGPKGYERSDERIQEEICERLTHDPLIDASDISIECRNGVVTLEGGIERRALKHRAEDMVAAVSGVREVHNRLTVQSHGMHSDSQPRSGEDSRTGQQGQRQQGQQASQGTTGGVSTGTPTETRSGQTSGGASTTRQ